MDLGRRLFHPWREGRAEIQGLILPLIFPKRLCDVFDDELNRIAAEVGSRKKAFQLAKRDHTASRDSASHESEGIPQVVSETKDNLVRVFLPLEPADPEQPVWSVIRKLSDKIGEGVTTHMRAIAKENPSLQGIIDRVDFNATTHGRPQTVHAEHFCGCRAGRGEVPER
jgi:type I restriction enzyme M protein